MSPFTRFSTLIAYNMSDSVPETNVDMAIYKSDCGTYHCRAGWGTKCDLLQADGYTISDNNNIMICNEIVSYRSKTFLAFFGITIEQSLAFFDPELKGTKKELLETWKKYLNELTNNQ